MTHDEPNLSVLVTYDSSLPEYTITLTRIDPWPDGPIFAMAFEGTRPIQISTDRHTVSGDGESLTVKDTGFGNVLDGLAMNQIATAQVGETGETFSLADAKPAVDAFRKCPAIITS